MLLVLSLAPALKEWFNKLIKGKSQTNRDQKSNLLFLQRHDQSQKCLLNQKNDDCENISSVNPLYLLVNHESGYIKEKNENKHLIFDDSVNENKSLLNKYADVKDVIKNEIKAINSGEENNYKKDYMKIKFISNDDLPLNMPLNFHARTMVIRSLFGKGGKHYPQVFLGEFLYELKEWK